MGFILEYLEHSNSTPGPKPGSGNVRYQPWYHGVPGVPANKESLLMEKKYNQVEGILLSTPVDEAGRQRIRRSENPYKEAIEMGVADVDQLKRDGGLLIQALIECNLVLYAHQLIDYILKL